MGYNTQKAVGGCRESNWSSSRVVNGELKACDVRQWNFVGTELDYRESYARAPPGTP